MTSSGTIILDGNTAMNRGGGIDGFFDSSILLTGKANSHLR